MIANLTSRGRHLTIIIDPHIKATNSYYVHNDCIARDYYTKNKDGSVYEGMSIVSIEFFFTHFACVIN